MQFDNSRTYYNFDRTIKVSLHDRNNSIENFLTSTIYKEKNTLLREESFHPVSKTITFPKNLLFSSSSSSGQDSRKIENWYPDISVKV